MSFTATATHLDAWDVAYDAALASLTATRVAGTFGNAKVYAAIASACSAVGITPAEAAEVTPSVVRAALDTIADRKAIVAAIGHLL